MLLGSNGAGDANTDQCGDNVFLGFANGGERSSC
jgi:hypothetical protein